MHGEPSPQEGNGLGTRVDPPGRCHSVPRAAGPSLTKPEIGFSKFRNPRSDLASQGGLSVLGQQMTTPKMSPLMRAHRTHNCAQDPRGSWHRCQSDFLNLFCTAKSAKSGVFCSFFWDGGWERRRRESRRGVEVLPAPASERADDVCVKRRRANPPTSVTTSNNPTQDRP